MSDENLETVDGGSLRKKLEEALAENKRLAQRVAASEAARVIAEHGYSLVKPEDLAGVPLDQIEEKAKELQESAEAEKREVVKSVLAELSGLEGSALDEAVDEFVSGRRRRETPELQDLAALPGERPALSPKVPPITDAWANLEQHFAQAERRK